MTTDAAASAQAVAVASSVPVGIQHALVQEYRGGRKVAGLLSRYQVSRAQFYAVLRVHGVPVRHPAMSEYDQGIDVSGIPAGVQDAVVNVYVGGGSVRAVADMFHLSQGEVRAVLQARGIAERAKR